MRYFCQTQLAKSKDYAVFLFQHSIDDKTQARIAKLQTSTTGGHADEMESSQMMTIKPDVVKIELASAESGEYMHRLQLRNAYTGIWWYAAYPNHYAGDAKDSNAELGEVSIEQCAAQLAGVIRAIKDDTATLHLQNEFFKESLSPLETTVKRTG